MGARGVRARAVREISRLTGTHAGTLARELGKLSEAGILNKRRVGNQLQYSANRGSPVFEELASLLRKTSGLVDVLADALLPFAEHIVFAFVFGSVAGGREHAGSDVDLLLVGDVDFAQAVTALHPAETTLRREINAKVYGVDGWVPLVAQGRRFGARSLGHLCRGLAANRAGDLIESLLGGL